MVRSPPPRHPDTTLKRPLLANYRRCVGCIRLLIAAPNCHIILRGETAMRPFYGPYLLTT